MNDTNLVTNAAYILFYQNRRLTRNSSTGNSSAASTSSAGSGLDHWVSKMPPFSYNNKNSSATLTGTTGVNNNNTNNNMSNKQSKSQEALCQDKVIEEKNMNNFNRGCRNYSTLQPVKRSTTNLDDEDSVSLKHVSTEYDDDETPARIEWVRLL